MRAAERAMAHGRYAEAEALARSRADRDPDAAAILARLAVVHGRYDEAAAQLQPAVAAKPAGEAALEWGLLLIRRGRRDEARRVLAPVAASASSARTADELYRAARAAWALGQFRTANSLFRDAAAALPDDPAVNTAWGELLLEKHNRADAARSFRMALARDADWAPAHLGLARAVADEDPGAADASVKRVLAIDGSLVGAHLFLAEAAIGSDRLADARAAIRQALASNPRSPEAHALAAAVAHLEGRSDQFQAARQAALAVNPTYGDLYRVTAAAAAGNQHYDEAVALARQAVALEPDNVRARAELGLHLLRVGEEREARTALTRAFDADPYNLVTYNLLQLLDTLETFVSFRAGGAVVRLHPSEAPVLQHYAVPIVEEALASLSARYQITPRGPILVEIFPKHDDFAVRTFGLPGLLGALGACFGRVVTLSSPHARPPGTFNWQATLWHELAHVFTLQLSDFRVPRWLTEGVSVYEEGRVRAEWARDSELAFAKAYAEGKVPALSGLNHAFTRPDLVTLAYFESLLVVELLIEQHGQSGLVALLRAFGEGLDTDTALRKTTGAGLDALQRALDVRLRERYGRVGQALKVPEGVTVPRPGDTAAVQALASRYPDSYPIQMAAGQALAAAGLRDAAWAAFSRAAQLVPSAVGPDSPHARMAELAERSGDRPRALAALRTLLALDHTNVEAARRLAALADKAGDADSSRLARERIVTVEPFDAHAHTVLGRLALARKDLPLALREFRAALAAGAADVPSARCDLGEALLAAGQRAEARREVLAALEDAPAYERAQLLLLRIIEGKIPAVPF